jgi:hypothetical protein
MTVTAATPVADMVAWIERLVADSPKLAETRPEIHTDNGHLWVTVTGGLREAHAWQAATHGRAMPSTITAGVRRQEVWGLRVSVAVIDDPNPGAR